MSTWPYRPKKFFDSSPHCETSPIGSSRFGVRESDTWGVRFKENSGDIMPVGFLQLPFRFCWTYLSTIRNAEPSFFERMKSFKKHSGNPFVHAGFSTWN